MSWFAVGGAALTAVSGYAKSKSDKKKAETELHHVYDALKQLPISVKRGSLRPPKAN